MKKVFVALTLMMFVGSMTATVYAASNGAKTEVSKKEDEKRKKKSKKKGCSKEGSCCQKKAA